MFTQTKPHQSVSLIDEITFLLLCNYNTNFFILTTPTLLNQLMQNAIIQKYPGIKYLTTDKDIIEFYVENKDNQENFVLIYGQISPQEIHENSILFLLNFKMNHLIFLSNFIPTQKIIYLQKTSATVFQFLSKNTINLLPYAVRFYPIDCQSQMARNIKKGLIVVTPFTSSQAVTELSRTANIQLMNNVNEDVVKHLPTSVTTLTLDFQGVHYINSLHANIQTLFFTHRKSTTFEHIKTALQYIKSNPGIQFCLNNYFDIKINEKSLRDYKLIFTNPDWNIYDKWDNYFESGLKQLKNLLEVETANRELSEDTQTDENTSSSSSRSGKRAADSDLPRAKKKRKKASEEDIIYFHAYLSAYLLSSPNPEKKVLEDFLSILNEEEKSNLHHYCIKYFSSSTSISSTNDISEINSFPDNTNDVSMPTSHLPSSGIEELSMQQPIADDTRPDITTSASTTTTTTTSTVSPGRSRTVVTRSMSSAARHNQDMDSDASSSTTPSFATSDGLYALSSRTRNEDTTSQVIPEKKDKSY